MNKSYLILAFRDLSHEFLLDFPAMCEAPELPLFFETKELVNGLKGTKKKKHGPQRHVQQVHLSSDQNPYLTLHYTGWFIGILTLAYYNPLFKWVAFHPLLYNLRPTRVFIDHLHSPLDTGHSMINFDLRCRTACDWKKMIQTSR